MRKMMIALGITAAMLFAGSALAADQNRIRSKDQLKTNYQTGIQKQTRTQDKVKSQAKDQTQSRVRAKDGSCNTTK